MPNSPEKIRFLGLRVDNVNLQDVHGFIENTVRQKRKAAVLHLNVHGACLAWKHSWLADFFEAAELVFCDGDGIRWGLKGLALPVPPKITYDRWIWQLTEFAAAKGLSFYFLGGKPGVAQAGAERLQSFYPSLKITGTHHGYFEREGEENRKIVDEINRLKPDILIIGFGMPLQEKWLSENRDKLNVSVFLTGGAVFEYAAGTFKRAPQWMLALHLEWLFRLCYDPRRLFVRYVTELPYFFYRIFIESLRTKKKDK